MILNPAMTNHWKLVRRKKEDLLHLLPLLRPEVRQFYIILFAEEEPSEYNHDPDLEITDANLDLAGITESSLEDDLNIVNTNVSKGKAKRGRNKAVT